jgi:hypothetical protein
MSVGILAPVRLHCRHHVSQDLARSLSLREQVFLWWSKRDLESHVPRRLPVIMSGDLQRRSAHGSNGAPGGWMTG